MRQTSTTRERLTRKSALRRRIFEVLESRRLLAADATFDWMEPGHWHGGWEMTPAEFQQYSPFGPMQYGAYDQYLTSFDNHDCDGGDGPPHEPGCSCGQCTAVGPTLFVERPQQTFDFIEEGGGSSGSSAPAALADTFLLHSLPNADHTIYLDFNGHVTEGTTWNASSGFNSIVSPAYDPAGNGAGFTDSELTQIQGIWKRVAEDFSPFEINVTTEDPGAAALSKTGGSDTQWGSRVVITEDWDNCGCGGFAYLTSFNDSVDEPVFVFNTSAIGVSAATTHEVGHALGLSHDGTTAGAAYYGGHGSGEVAWGPIMGSGYSTNMTTWDSGQYYQANNNEDDWQIITSDNGFGYRSDDHGGTIGTASTLEDEGANAGDANLVDVSGFGVISQGTDQDWFSFETGEGQISLTIDSYVQETFVSNGVGFTRSIEATPVGDQGSNLDVVATIYDSGQNVVATSNPATELNASFSNLDLPAGTYYIAIDGTGYGNWAANPPVGFEQSVSRGQYLISGTVVASSQTLVAANDAAITQVDTPIEINVLENDSDPQNGSFAITSLGSPANGQATHANGVVTYTPDAGFSGTDTLTYSITDDQQETATATVTVSVLPPTPPILFVDDDQGASYERFYTAALDANTLQYDSWQVSSQGLPGTANLSDYDVVVWNTGFEYSATGSGLASAEQVALSGYLDGGGGLFLVGQDILYNGVSASFQADYLKLASFTSDVRNLSQYVGVSGSSISDDMNLSFSLPSDFSADWSDSLSPASGAEGVFYRNSVNGDAQPFNTIGYGGEDFRVVFMAAPFEGISASAGDPNNQAFVMGKVVEFLMPPVTATGDVVVSAPSSSGVTTEAGDPVSFTVVLTEAPVSDVIFSVASSDSGEGAVDVTQLTFTPDNWGSAQTVTVTGVDDSLVDGDVGYSILLGVADTTDSNYSGLDPADVSLSNADNDVAGLSLDLGAGSVSEGSTLVGVVSRNTDTSGALVVSLESSDAGEAAVSSSVTIPEGQSSVDFAISGVADGLVDGSQSATITGTATGFESGTGSVTVLDVDSPTLKLSIAETEVAEDGSVTATVSRNTDSGSSLLVSLFSSDSGEAAVAQDVVIPSGSLSADFSVLGQLDGEVDGNQPVTVTANAVGFADGSDSIDVTDVDSGIYDLFYFSRKNNGTVDGVLFQNEDIVAYNGSEFRVFFDGTPWASGLTLDAFYIQDDGDILMSYSVAGSITGGSLSFDDSDIIRFSPATQTWALYFDGSDVGLSSNGEDVDSIGFAPDGRLVISTSGSTFANGVSARDEDLIVFNQTSLGANTAGSFEMYFDGSDVGLSTSSSEDVDAISITGDGTIYLSTVGNFSVIGTSGADEDVFAFEPATLGASTGGTFRPGLYFDGSAYGFGNDVGGLQVADPPAIGSGAAAAAPGLGAVAPDGLLVIMDFEPVVPMEVLGPMTFAQWQSLRISEIVLAPTSEAPEMVDQNKADKTSDDDLHVMCLDEVFFKWGL